jgi:3',5'-cyclic AMP phosphodiesterase CpdA
MRIAHLSDVHLLESRQRVGERYSLRTRLVSYARALDAKRRAENLRRALAVASRADHVVVTGDLTEMGSDAQFGVLAEILHDSKITPERVTLVPGNHDAYTSADGWTRALAGPLRELAATSAGDPGKIVDLGALTLLPVDATRFQSIAQSGGEVRPELADALDARLSDADVARRPVVVVQHHPPFAPQGRVWRWVDGLRGAARLLDVLRTHVNVSLLHGHKHVAADYLVGRTRVFSASAVVDDTDAARVRFYELRDGVLQVAA